VSSPSVYRKPALALPSRKVIAFGTGERLVLHVPMTPSEVVEALSSIVQSEPPTGFKMFGRLSFYGFVSASEFRLKPLWAKAHELYIRGKIQPLDDSSVVTVEIRRELAPLLKLIVILLFLSIFLIASTSSVSEYVACTLMLFFMLTTAVAELRSIRAGIGSVRLRLMEGLEGTNIVRTDENVNPSKNPRVLDFVKDPDQAVNKLDARLRDRLK